jgi:ParB/RepB/Spo0J family partition protein
MKTFEVDIDLVEQNENSRVNYQDSDMNELMGSMKAYGLLEPIGIRKISNIKYEAIFGNRRLIAAKKLGWATISAHVIDVRNDVDRDILNLIENFKRQNTTLAEDGRMFFSLIDRGLSPTEIAAKLGISMNRVQAAIDGYRGLPKDYHHKVVNNHKGPQKAGTIAASTAMQILNLKKSLSLKDNQARSLLEYSTKDNVTQKHLGLIAPLVKQGYDIEEALQVAEHYKTVRLTFLMDKTNIRKLEQKYKKSLTDILMDVLYEHKEFKIAKRAGTGKKASKQFEEEEALA